jgi:hypothetical protein
LLFGSSRRLCIAARYDAAVHRLETDLPIVTVAATFPIVQRPVPLQVGRDLVDPRSLSQTKFSVVASGRGIDVDILGDEQFVQATLRGQSISAGFDKWLASTPGLIGQYPEVLRDEIEETYGLLIDAATQVVEAIKYFLMRPDMPERVINAATQFSCLSGDGSLRCIPVVLTLGFRMHTATPLSEPIARMLQEGLTRGYTPLTGMRHLYRAMQEREPRFRWIDTTIALELSVKEALIRQKPEIETLLIELPSPPLTKLYGSLLQWAFGVRSPYLKDIEKGMRVRNQLVHRPTGVAVSAEEARLYLESARKAIGHLFLLLYPNWPLAKNLEQSTFTSS